MTTEKQIKYKGTPKEDPRHDGSNWHKIWESQGWSNEEMNEVFNPWEGSSITSEL